jgi:hypothetical protein
MTKKHFEAIARILSNLYGYDMSSIDFDAGFNRAIERAAEDLADYFMDENPRFDRQRFLTACGL